MVSGAAALVLSINPNLNRSQVEDILFSTATDLGEEGKRLMKEEVDADDIAENIAKATGIPVSKMMTGEREKLLHMETRHELGAHGCGQLGLTHVNPDHRLQRRE